MDFLPLRVERQPSLSENYSQGPRLARHLSAYSLQGESRPKGLTGALETLTVRVIVTKDNIPLKQTLASSLGSDRGFT